MNKVASGVQIRFNVDASPTLPDEVKVRLRGIAKNRITEDGTLIIEAKRFRTQEQNREDGLARLVALILQATEKPKPRKKTRPSAAANAKRLDEKRRRGQAKQLRRTTPSERE